MNHLHPLLLILFIALFHSSCSSPEQPQKANEKEQHDHSETEKTVVELNEGQRWPANAETTHGIDTMIVILANFEATNDESYTALKNELNQEFLEIFKNCTMKGEAHNQLHNYLLPLRSMFAGLEKPETRDQTVFELKEYLGTYTNYFE